MRVDLRALIGVDVLHRKSGTLQCCVCVLKVQVWLGHRVCCLGEFAHSLPGPPFSGPWPAPVPTHLAALEGLGVGPQRRFQVRQRHTGRRVLGLVWGKTREWVGVGGGMRCATGLIPVRLRARHRQQCPDNSTKPLQSSNRATPIYLCSAPACGARWAGCGLAGTAPPGCRRRRGRTGSGP